MMEQVLVIVFMKEREVNPLFASEIGFELPNNELAAVWETESFRSYLKCL